METEHRVLIELLYFGKVDEEEFLRRFPINLTEDTDFFLKCLLDAKNSRNSYDLVLGLTLVCLRPQIMYSKKYVTALCELLLEDWHELHENIASCLIAIKAPNSVNALYEACLLKLDYREYDDSYELARKCIRALGGINSGPAIERLLLLTQSEIEEIKLYAIQQLEKLR